MFTESLVSTAVVQFRYTPRQHQVRSPGEEANSRPSIHPQKTLGTVVGQNELQKHLLKLRKTKEVNGCTSRG